MCLLVEKERRWGRGGEGRWGVGFGKAKMIGFSLSVGGEGAGCECGGGASPS